MAPHYSDKKALSQRTDQLRWQAYGTKQHVTDRVRKASGWGWGSGLAFSTAMNTGLGAYLGTLGYATIAGVLGTVTVSASVVTLIFMGLTEGWRRYKERMNGVKEEAITAMVNEFLREDDKPLKPRAAAAYVLYIRALADDDAASTVRGPDNDFVRKCMRVRPTLQQDQEEHAEKRNFLLDYADNVADEGEPNPWFRAAVPRMEGDRTTAGGWGLSLWRSPSHETVTDIVCRGLSPRLRCGMVQHNAKALYDLTAWKRDGKCKCPAPNRNQRHWNSDSRNLQNGHVPWRTERDVAYFAISYRRNQTTDAITQEDLQEALQAIDAYVRGCKLGTEYRVWLDLLVFEDGLRDRRWETYGLLAYLLFPTYRVQAAREQARAWLMLEDLCATAGPGKVVDSGQASTFNMARDMARRMPLLDAFSAVAEVVHSDVNLSGSMRYIDREHLRRWARPVLYGSNLNAVYGRFLTQGGTSGLRARKRFNYMSLFIGPLAHTRIAGMYLRTLNQSAQPPASFLSSLFSSAQTPQPWSAAQLMHVSQEDLDPNNPLLRETAVEVLKHRRNGDVCLRTFTDIREAVVMNVIHLTGDPTSRCGQVKSIACLNGTVSPDVFNESDWRKKEENLRMGQFDLSWSG